MRPKSHLMLSAALSTLLYCGAAEAEWPAPAPESTASWHRLGRTLGVGWSDGYHACLPRPVRLGENLPPRGNPPSPICGNCTGAPQRLGGPRLPTMPMCFMPAAAPTPVLPESLPPSVLQRSEAGQPDGTADEPAERISRAPVAPWKWIREPGASGTR